MDRLGKYELLKHIADGATAAIFLAHDPFAGRNVAIKLFRSQVFNENERGAIARKLFMSEAALAGKLDHPHIVRIFDAVMEEGRSYIVMEYVPGGTLHAYTSPDRLLPLADVIEIAFKCSRALGYAQRLGVIHCDLKPANILLAGEPGGTDIKVSDFGSAFNLAAEETIIVGLGYSAPSGSRSCAPLMSATRKSSAGCASWPSSGTSPMPICGRCCTSPSGGNVRRAGG